MSRQKKKREKWIDPRVPVEVVQCGKWTVTIFDMEAYNASLREYPDDPNDEKPIVESNHHAQSQFKKGKSSARYGWNEKLKTPLPLTVPTIKDVC
jgi:hypothetical protein